MSRALHAVLHRPALMFLLLSALVVLPIYAAPRLWAPAPTFHYLFALDITQSMNVRDAGPEGRSRLEAARATVIAALSQLPCGSRASVALFADSETLPLFEPLEICDHFPAMERAIAGLDWRMAWSGNSQIDAGFAGALEEAAARQLDLVFITDGDQKPRRRAVRMTRLQRLRGAARGYVVGVGGIHPRPVPRLDAQNQLVGYWESNEAQRQGFNPNLVSSSGGIHFSVMDLDALPTDEHLSALREPELRDLARAAGLSYLRLDEAGALMRALADPDLARTREAPRDLRFVFGLAAVALLLTGWLWRENAV